MAARRKQKSRHRSAAARSRETGPSRDEVNDLVAAYRAGRYHESLAGGRRFARDWPAMAFGWMMTAASQHALGDLEAAAQGYARAVELEPGNAEAHNNLGNICRELGRAQSSVESHRRALSLRPDFPEAQFNLGLSLAAVGEQDEAAAIFRRVAARQPELAEAHNQLGNACRAQGRLEEAAAAYRKAVSLAPGHAGIRGNLAAVLADLGQTAEAESAYREALAGAPADADLLSNFGLFLMRQGRVEEAEHWFRSTLAQRSDSAELHNNLGIALRSQGRLVDAAASFEAAVRLAPASASMLHNLGDARMDLGLLDEAESLHRRAVAAAPASATAHRNLGVLLAVLGRPEEALDCYRKALELDPARTELVYRIAQVKQFEDADPDLERIDSRLAGSGLSDDARAHLHYAAGKARADIGGEPGRAFEHYAAGAAARRRTLSYDVSDDEARFQAVARAFPPGFVEANGPAHDNALPMPVLIVGMPRSGTTLVESILASSQKVFAAGERFDLDRLVEAVDRREQSRYPQWVGRLNPSAAQEIGRRYARNLCELAPEASCVIDKMPNNFQYLGLVVSVLRNVRVIHVQRDPRDTCFSCFTHLFEGGQRFSYDLGELGRYYRAYERLMAHWREVIPGEVLLEVRYEDLVAEPEAGMRRLYAHCGLEWHDAALSFHRTQRAVPTASLMQVRQPIYARAVGRWQEYAAQLQPLLEALDS